MIRVATGRRQFINAFVIKWEFDQDVWGVALEFVNGDQHMRTTFSIRSIT
jgi:hypothetical protein